MEKRRLGRTEMQVSVLGFGGAEIGHQNVDQARATVLLNGALDAGINVIDTAECYGGSEELVGNALAHRSGEFFVFTKCGHAVEPGETNWEHQTILTGIERSLKRLKRDHVDLLQLHSCPSELLKQGDIIDLLERIKQSGKTRFIGCSADGRAASYAIQTGRFDVLQTSFSIGDQEALAVNFPLVREQDMGVIVKRPIANAVWKHAAKPADPWLHAYWERIEKLDYPFLREPGEESFSTALRFALTPAETTTAIVGTVNPAHLASNARYIAEGRLPNDAFAAIRVRWDACGGAEWPGKG
ncbi:MAG: aldo/keto reductase [Negativicutes bacterium]|nr:aldo/keto reductase [Negativicutes bacterium]